MLSLNVAPRKPPGWFRRLQLWATGDWQLHHNNAPTHASHLMQVLGEASNHPGDSAPYSPDLAPSNFWLFPKLKSPLKRKRFQTVGKIQENTTEQLMVIGRPVSGPKVPTLKGTEASLSCVQWFLYLVSSINVSVFHITWLDTSWTDLMRTHIHTNTVSHMGLCWSLLPIPLHLVKPSD